MEQHDQFAVFVHQHHKASKQTEGINESIWRLSFILTIQRNGYLQISKKKTTWWEMDKDPRGRDSKEQTP